MLTDGGEVMTERDSGLQPFYAMEINALASDLERGAARQREGGRAVAELAVVVVAPAERTTGIIERTAVLCAESHRARERGGDQRWSALTGAAVRGVRHQASAPAGEAGVTGRAGSAIPAAPRNFDVRHGAAESG